MEDGIVVSIHLIPEGGGAPLGVDEVRAVAGKGLEGDRYFKGTGTYSDPDPKRHLTLIEQEAIEAVARDYAIELEPGQTRRNIAIRGLALNHLVDVVFKVGEATVRGIKLCEPCMHLEELSKPGVRKALIHRGGLRCEIIEGGTIRVGDAAG